MLSLRSISREADVHLVKVAKLRARSFGADAPQDDARGGGNLHDRKRLGYFADGSPMRKPSLKNLAFIACLFCCSVVGAAEGLGNAPKPLSPLEQALIANSKAVPRPSAANLRINIVILAGTCCHGQRFAQFRPAATAIAHQEIEQAAHALDVRRVTNAAPFPSGAHQSGMGQHCQVCRHGILAHAQFHANLTGWQTLGASFDQQAQDIQPGFLAECREGR